MNETLSKTAIVFGASGLVGRFLTEELAHDARYGSVTVFVRKEISTFPKNVRQVTFNPESIQEVTDKIIADHVYCCIGTTRKKAGSNEKFYKTDHDLVERIAQAASINKASAFIVVSSIGASAESGNFYLKTKGQMENSIRTFNFSNLSILRPSVLLGIRHESRFGEEIGKKLAIILTPVLVGKIRKYRPIHAAAVAKAMVSCAFKGKGEFVLESDEIEKLSQNTN
jgi:uncharacterized protein YbjT (DUF2867 family)